MGARNHALLPHLARAAREAREAAGFKPGEIAVHVRKRNGKMTVADSTISRFENAHHWPENPDAMVRAYAKALKIRELDDLWDDELYTRALQTAGTSCRQ